METELAAGIFAILGAIVGGIFTLLAARAGNQWARARRHICRLSGQVAAYHRLEELYKEALASADPELGSTRTILLAMRDHVESEGLTRPQMTGRDAQRIRDTWCS